LDYTSEVSKDAQRFKKGLGVMDGRWNPEAGRKMEEHPKNNYNTFKIRINQRLAKPIRNIRVP
jgi:hypothetical protein